MRRFLGFLAAPMCLGGVMASGADFQALFHNVPGVNGSAVPGIPGASFGPGTGTTHFDRVFGSGNYWGLTCDTDLATTEDEVLIVNGTVVGREGTPAPWTGGTENYGLLDGRVPVNSSGIFAFATNTSGPTTADEYIVSGNFGAGTFATVARESDPVPGMPGVNYSLTLDTSVVTADGRVGYSGQVVGAGVTTNDDEILFLGTAQLAREGVTVPGNQVAGGTSAWDNFDLDGYWVSADGNQWIVRGDLEGDTTIDKVAAVNGDVVLQEGQIIPGLDAPIAASAIDGVFMDESGNWYARGNNTDGDDWIVRNGAVIARKGDSVTGGAEAWSDAAFADLFFLHVGNSLGDYVIGGVTDEIDPLRDGVLVFNGTTVVARQGDPVDLDGNGLFDDDAYFNTFGNDDAFLSDDLKLYIVATIMNGAGTAIGQGLFLTTVPEPAALLMLGVAALVLRRR